MPLLTDGLPHLVLCLQPDTALDDRDERTEAFEAVSLEELVGDVGVRHEVLPLYLLACLLDPAVEVLADLHEAKLELVELVLWNEWGVKARVDQSSDAYCLWYVLALLELLEVTFDPLVVWPARILLLNPIAQRLQHVRTESRTPQPLDAVDEGLEVRHAVIDVLVDNGVVWVLRSLLPPSQEGCFEVEDGGSDDAALSAGRHISVIHNIDTAVTVRAAFVVVGIITRNDGALGESGNGSWRADELGSDDILWKGLPPLEDIPHLESESRLPFEVEGPHLLVVDVGDGCGGWDGALAHVLAVVLCLLLPWFAPLAGIASYALAPRASPSARGLADRMGLGRRGRTRACFRSSGAWFRGNRTAMLGTRPRYPPHAYSEGSRGGRARFAPQKGHS
jgi:hypothetical protein